MVTYHYVKFYVSIIIHLEVININVWNFNFPIGFYSNPHLHIEKCLLVAIFKMATTIPQKFNVVRYHQNLICGYIMMSRIDLNEHFALWQILSLIFCGIVVAILKMETGRNFVGQ
jgi:hypothetical protein